MIITETYDVNGRSYTRTYSDLGLYVVRDGISYEDAVDPTEFGRVYTEGDPIIEPEAEPEEIAEILLGVEHDIEDEG